jgi:phosphoglycerate dehydrogenase-like enzyme
MNAQRFAAMKPGARFYNIGSRHNSRSGRLLRVLESGTLALAYLDVTDPEPLPATIRCGRRPTALSRRTPPAATRVSTSD